VRVSFLVPAYNEEATIGEGPSTGIAALGLDAQVIVVDDGLHRPHGPRSPRSEGATVIRQKNAGKGAAIRAAIGVVDGDIAVIQDADMEYDPAEVPELIEPILRGVGRRPSTARALRGRESRRRAVPLLAPRRQPVPLASDLCALQHHPLRHGKPGTRRFARTCSGRSTCARTASGSSRRSPPRSAKRKLRIYELPISYYGRTFAEGKNITWRDGFRAIWVLFRVRVAG